MKRKIAAIMAADIAGYSKLVADDEEETLRRLASYRSVFDDFIAKAAGRVFNTAGDAVLAEFPSAVEAVRCAIDIQESLRTRNLAYPPSRQMNFRIGITVGDVVEREGDLLGDGVNIAARLEGLAEPGGICVSRSIYEQVTNKLSVQFADIGEQQVKNIPTPIHAYMVAVSSSQEQPRTPRKTNPSKMAAAVVLACIAVVGAVGGIYWVSMRAPRTGPATAAPPFTAHVNEANVHALAAKQSIPLPQTIRFVEPASAVPKKSAEYIGAWGGDRRWGNGGRQTILLVTYIDEAGAASGVICFGPPTAHTLDQHPANYFAFTGTITRDGLKFETANGKWKYEFKLRPDGIMEGHLDTPANTHPTISIERIG
jgi:class 3 adenylate cyclase